MELENYFDFLSDDVIRIKGTRVGIETVLSDYLNGVSPEEIAARYLTLSLEQVYATLTYYFHNQTQIDAYLASWQQHADQAEREYYQNPPDLASNLRLRIQNHRQIVVAEDKVEYAAKVKK